MVFLKVEKSSPYFSRFQVRSWQPEGPKAGQLRLLVSPALVWMTCWDAASWAACQHAICKLTSGLQLQQNTHTSWQPR